MSFWASLGVLNIEPNQAKKKNLAVMNVKSWFKMSKKGRKEAKETRHGVRTLGDSDLGFVVDISMTAWNEENLCQF